jgi:hypothetical protein
MKRLAMAAAVACTLVACGQMGDTSAVRVADEIPRETTTTTRATTTTYEEIVTTTSTASTTTTTRPTTTTTTPTTVPPTTAPPPPPPPPPPTTAAPTPAPSGCDPNYSGCVPIASDVDCAGGSGNGPAYVQGPVTIVGSDIYDLDSDNDGLGCES